MKLDKLIIKKNINNIKFFQDRLPITNWAKNLDLDYTIIIYKANNDSVCYIWICINNETI